MLLLFLLAMASASASSSDEGQQQQKGAAVDASFVRIEKMRHQHFIMPIAQEAATAAERRADRAMDPVAQRGAMLARATKDLADVVTRNLESTRDNEFARREARMRIQERMRSAGLMRTDDDN